MQLQLLSKEHKRGIA